MWLLFMTFLLAHHFSHLKANLDYSKFQSIAHTPTTSTAYITSALLPFNYKQQKTPTWPATVTRNNWFILQPTSNDAATVEVPLESSLNQRARDITKVTTSALNNYAKHITMEAGEYYSYDDSNGNYHLSRKDMRNIEPYILTISKQRSRQIVPLNVNNKAEQRQKDTNNSYQHSLVNQWMTSSGDRTVNNHNNPGHLYSENNHITGNNLQNEHNNGVATGVNKQNAIVKQSKVMSLFGWQDIESKVKGDSEPGDNNASVNINQKAENVENIMNSMQHEGFNDVLMPLARILDSVKYYCEALKQVINEDDEDFASNNLEASNEVETVTRTTASTLATQTAGDTAQLMAAEVQGRHTEDQVASVGHLITQQSVETTMLSPTTTTTQLNMPRSFALTASLNTTNSTATTTTTTTATAKSLTSTALFIGRAKKLKKKLKKLMLPLLLAYKLKFIALVPLLIGGLTLLVGSTGLAGFFFALFVTVMALKGGGDGGGSAHKSIVINKEW